MKLLGVFGFFLFACTVPAFEVEEFFDRLDSALTFSAFRDSARARLSGTIDLEGYHFQQPAPGLINSKIDKVLGGRFTSAEESGHNPPNRP